MWLFPLVPSAGRGILRAPPPALFNCVTSAVQPAEHAPCDLVGGVEDVRHLRDGGFSLSDVRKRRRIEAGTCARHLVGEIDGSILPNKILAPAHSSVRSRLPRLAREATAMDHDDR